MLGSERRAWILRQLGTRGTVRTMELAAELGVSDETVRKDLIELETQGEIRRDHGGAVLARTGRYGLPMPERESLHRAEKAAIARAACSLIRPRETLFLDASSTVLAMTAWFPDIEATVLTNANHVVASMSRLKKIDLVCTGGDYERRSRSYTGVLAEEAVQRYLIERLFVGVDGLHPLRGASEINPGQARLKERLIPLAEQVVVFGHVAAMPGFVVEQIAKLLVRLRFARAQFLEERQGVLGMGESEAHGSVVANVEQIVGTQRVDVGRGLFQRRVFVAQAEDDARLDDVVPVFIEQLGILHAVERRH